jgi:predicted RNA binding protein YcfA (HicA-like mRNA interferase family)
MASFPVMSGRKVIRVFESLGWQVARQPYHHGQDDHEATLSIPDHKELAKGTLRSLIRSADLTVAEFIAAARKI